MNDIFAIAKKELPTLAYNGLMRATNGDIEAFKKLTLYRLLSTQSVGKKTGALVFKFAKQHGIEMGQDVEDGHCNSDIIRSWIEDILEPDRKKWCGSCGHLLRRKKGSNHVGL